MKNNARRTTFISLIAGLLLLGTVTFNACQSPFRGNDRGGNTSTAGNPMTPISNKTLTAVCTVVTQCHSVAWSTCEAGVLATTGIAAKLGLAQLASDPFSAFITAESAGQISGNATALNQCSQSLTALPCGDARVQSAYQPTATQPFAEVPQMFSSDAGSCPDVAQAVTPPNWTWPAVAASSTINFASSQNSYDPQMTVFASKLYMTWVENNSGYNVRVAVTDGTTARRFVDGGTGSGLNFDGAQDADSPFLAEFNGSLYALWIETSGGRPLLRAKVYNGNDSAPSWTAVDNGGLNRRLTSDASTPEMVVFNSKLYAVWTEKNSTIDQVRVAVFNGQNSTPAWSFVDGNLVTGLNFNSSKVASNPRAMVFNSALYLTWSEVATDNGIKQVRVARYGGNDGSPAWSFVDGNAVHGRNYDAGQNAQNPQLAAFNSKLYLTWQEWNSPSSEQIRVAAYDGSSWSFVDGGGSKGLNWNTSADAQVPQLLEAGGWLYVTWREQVSGRGIIRVRMFNGNDALPVWTFIDGNATNGLNVTSGDAVFSYKRNPMLALLGGQLHLLWDETNRIRLRSATAN